MSTQFSSILHAAFRFLSGTALSRISGLARDVTMAACFGATPSVAAFLVAFRLAHLLRRVFGEGALQTAFIPLYERFYKENPERADRFFLDLKGSLFLSLSGISLLAMGGLSLFGSGEIATLSILLLPSLPFICLFGLNASLLQCRNHYFIPGFAPVAFNLFWIVGALALKHLPDQEAMSYLALFVIFGCVAQWAMTLPQVLPTWHAHRRVSLFSTDVKALLAPLSLAILGVAASQINNALDPLFALYASPEAPAYLWYAVRMQQLPIALVGIALSTAILPPLARCIHGGDFSRYQSLLQKSLLSATVVMTLITLAIGFLSDRLINLVYGHGDFSPLAVAETSQCLIGYAIGLVPMAWVLILSPGCNAKGLYREPAIASSVSMIVNILLNALFVFGLGWGSMSVAVATSLSAFVNAAILCYVVFFQSSSRELRVPVKD